MAVGEAFLSAFLQVLFDRLASREFIDLLRFRNTPSGRGIGSKLKKVIEKLELIANYKDVLGLKDNDKLKDGNQDSFSEKARHSSYTRGRRDVLSKFEAFKGVEFLRTFLPLDPTGTIGVSYLANKVPHDLLPGLRYLRVLSFNACRITELPDSIDIDPIRMSLSR
ncbi:putative disease resistance rpp13-like protein 1 [Fagus crenata]